MDIEEYLRQKKSLERKKEDLESKHTVHEKPKKQLFERSPKRIEREERQVKQPRTSSSSVGWNLALFVLIVLVFVVTYFFPRYGPIEIEELVEDELEQSLTFITGSAIANNNPTPVPDSKPEPDDDPDDEPEPDPEPVEGPEVTMSLKDGVLANFFDENGKIDDETLNVWNTNQYDLEVHMQNTEALDVKCNVDRILDIDSNLDGSPDDDPKVSKIATVKLKPGEKLSPPIRNTIIATGSVVATYESMCYFCEEPTCQDIDKASKEESSVFLKVIINGDELNVNGTS